MEISGGEGRCTVEKALAWQWLANKTDGVFADRMLSGAVCDESGRASDSSGEFLKGGEKVYIKMRIVGELCFMEYIPIAAARRGSKQLRMQK